MFNKNTILEYLKINKNKFKDDYNVDDIALYGSYAKDNATNTSDIDILVSSQNNILNLDILKQNLQQHFDTTVDILDERNIILPTMKKMIHKDCIYV